MGTGDHTSEIIGMSVLGVLALFGTIENITVIFTVLRRFRLESWTYILICHLALCDLLTCLIAAPLWIAGHTGAGFNFCKSSFTATAAMILASCWTLGLIAYERYIYIQFPLRYPRIVTRTKILSAICAIWVSCLVVSASMITVGFNKPTTDHCFATLLVNRWIASVVLPVFSMIPVALMFVAYTSILRKALQQQRRGDEFGNSDERRTTATKLRKERRTIRMLYAIVVVYVICILPYSILAIVDVIDHTIMSVADRSKADNVAIFLFANAVINPVLYAMMNKEIRKEVLCIRNRVTPSSDW